MLVLLLRPRPFMAVPALANAFQKSAELKSTALPTAAGEVAEMEGVFWPVPEYGVMLRSLPEVLRRRRAPSYGLERSFLCLGAVSVVVLPLGVALPLVELVPPAVLSL